MYMLEIFLCLLVPSLQELRTCVVSCFDSETRDQDTQAIHAPTHHTVV